MKPLKNKCAKSVYIIKSDDKYKVGVSKDPQQRLRAIGIGGANLKLIYSSPPIYNSYEVESYLHSQLAEYAIGREWFSGVSEVSIMKNVTSAVETHGKHLGCDKDESAEPSFNFVYGGEIVSHNEVIKMIKSETEALKKENDAVLDLIVMVAINPKIGIIVDALLKLGRTYQEIRDFFVENKCAFGLKRFTASTEHANNSIKKL